MTSARVGQATLRSSPRTSRRNWPGPCAPPWCRGAGAGAALRAGLAVRADAAPWRCSMRFCLAVHRHGGDLDRIGAGIGEQGRRDSNPRPPVLETGALPIELLPYGDDRASLAADLCAPDQRDGSAGDGGASTAAAGRRRARRRRRRAGRGQAADGAVGRPPGPASVAPPVPTAARTAVRACGRGRPLAPGAPAGVRRPAVADRGRPGSAAQPRYWASSAWQRRQRSTWRRAARSATAPRRPGSGTASTPADAHPARATPRRPRRRSCLASARRREQGSRRRRRARWSRTLAAVSRDAQLGGDGLVGRS